VAYQIFSKRGNRSNHPPTLSIGKQGRIQLNKTACEAFGDPEDVKGVLLMYDKSANTVALRPLRKKDKRGYSINFNRAGGAALSCKSFIDFIGYDKEKTEWFSVEWNEAEQALEAKLVAVADLPAKQLGKKIEQYRRRRKLNTGGAAEDMRNIK
jgi:hypothetical protein